MTTTRLVVAAIALLAAACSNNSPDAGPPLPGATSTPERRTIPPVEPDNGATTSAAAPSSTTVAPTTTTTTTTTSTIAPTTTSSTTTTTTVPTWSTIVPPAPLELDPNDPNNQRTITPDQQPIIDAYIEALDTVAATVSVWPLDPDAPELVNGPFTARMREGIAFGMSQRTASNSVLDIGGGRTYRPYIIEDNDGDPNRVFIWDCVIDATFWKDVDTGEKAPPDAWPNAGPPGAEFAVVVVMVNVDGRWLMDEDGLEPRACL